MHRIPKKCLPSMISCLTLFISLRISRINSCFRLSRSMDASVPLLFRFVVSSLAEPLRFRFPRGESPLAGTDKTLLPFSFPLLPNVIFLSTASSLVQDENLMSCLFTNESIDLLAAAGYWAFLCSPPQLDVWQAFWPFHPS